MQVRDKIYVNGEWCEAHGEGTLEVINASTEEPMGSIPNGNESDVDAAVAAAAAAFEGWSQTSLEERLGYIDAIKAGVDARSEELIATIAGEVGVPVTWGHIIQVGLASGLLAETAQAARDFEWEAEVGNSLVVHEPIGVVGAITPWNYPLYLIICKVAPALAGGNTVVLKPSEIAPLNAFILTEIIHDAGLPAGVFNLVTGVGPVVGEAMAVHPDIDMISLTGSVRAGTAVTIAAAPTVKRVGLELGGKSANVVLDDADLDAAIGAGIFGCYLNSGQTCSALTRMLVPKSQHDDIVERARVAAEAMVVADPLEPGMNIGPLISAAQRDRVRQYIQTGIDEGATLVTGGLEPPEGMDIGYYVRATVFADVDNSMTIAREEIFGPVLAIIAYEDEDDAIRIANDSPYGLSGAVWSTDIERAERVARRMRTGQVEINGGAFNPLAPFGGYKQSGNGRERGMYGLEEFLVIKSMQR